MSHDDLTGSTGRSRFDWQRVLRHDDPAMAAAAIRAMLPDASDSNPEADASRVEDALETWRAARTEFERIERGLAARTAELAMIQELAQRTAEAHTPSELFGAAAEVLHRTGDVDVVAVLRREEGRLAASCYTTVPLAADYPERLVRDAIAFLGWAEPSAVDAHAFPVPGYDASRWPREAHREGEMTFLPVRGEGETAACVALVHARDVDAARQRILYAAANQLSLGLDRVLMAQRAERDRFRSILDSMAHAVVLTGPDLEIRQANHAAGAVLDRLGIAEGGSLAAGELGLRELVERLSDTAVSVEREARLAGGTIYHLTATPFRRVDGTPEGFVVVLIDVTESRKLQARLAQSEKMSSLGQMISGVAHELNNPLASILGYAQLLAATVADDGTRSRLDVLRTESQRCQKIVKNLLTFARRHEAERVPFSLNDVVRSVAGLLEYQLRVDDIELEIDLDDALPALVGDAHEIRQAVLNLVTNAHHALRDMGRAGRVRIATLGLEGGGVRIEVEDDGPGVPDELRERVFDPFFTTKDVGEGTGLGLALVYGTVTDHGGSIELLDRDGGGATFRIELPRLVPGEDLHGGDATDEEPAAKPSGETGAVLVVDDEPSVAELIRDALVAGGYRAELAESGTRALERLDATRFDAVVLDFRMPGLKGGALHDEMIERHPRLSGRLVLTTGDTVSREPEALAERLGIAVVHKPFDLDDLRDAVRAALVKDAPPPS